jgi:hypothetical protein
MLFWKAIVVAVLGLSATAFAAPQAKGSPKGGKRSSNIFMIILLDSSANRIQHPVVLQVVRWVWVGSHRVVEAQRVLVRQDSHNFFLVLCAPLICLVPRYRILRSTNLRSCTSFYEARNLVAFSIEVLPSAFRFI